MVEYINKQDLLEKVREQQNNIFGVPCIIAEIEKAETVEVVRCKDCKYCFDAVMGGMWCEHPDNIMPLGSNPNDFCSYGERKADCLTCGT